MSQPSAPAEVAPARRLYPPAEPWRVGLLCLSTLGVYPVFWMYRAGRDLRTLYPGRYRSWLWFFSPLVAITLPFSIRRLMNAFEQAAGTPQPMARYGAAIGGAAFVCAAGFRVLDHFEMPTGVYVALLFAWSIAFSLPQQVINAAKARLTDVEFIGTPFAFSRRQLACVIVCGLLSTGVILTMGYTELAAGLGKPLDAGSRYVDPEGKYYLDVPGEGWRIARIGEFSDGSADLELKGNLNDMYSIVFVHGRHNTLDGLAQFRMEEAAKAVTSPTCRESRSMVPGKMHVFTSLWCTGRYLGSPGLEMSQIIETDDGYYELYSHLSAPALSFKRGRDSLKRLQDSFTTQ